MFTVQLERLDPEMPQTQKKEVSSGKYKTEDREHNKKRNQWYRDEINSGFNLLMKWVPGTTRSSRPEILKKTVNYIKKLQNKEKEIEKAKKTEKYIKKLENKIKELEKELLKKKVNYIEELQKKIKELETSQTPPRESHSSQMEPEVVLASDPTGASTSSTMDVRTTSEDMTPEEVGSGEEELLANLQEELLESGIPDFNSMEDFTKWLEL
jgi:hypothetical protein